MVKEFLQQNENDPKWKNRNVAGIKITVKSNM